MDSYLILNLFLKFIFLKNINYRHKTMKFSVLKNNTIDKHINFIIFFVN